MPLCATEKLQQLYCEKGLSWLSGFDMTNKVVFFPLTLTLLLSFSEGTDAAAQFQYTCTCNRPAGNEFVVVTQVSCSCPPFPAVRV